MKETEQRSNLWKITKEDMDWKWTPCIMNPLPNLRSSIQFYIDFYFDFNNFLKY